MTIDDFLGRLQNVRKIGIGWSAQCPHHDDRRNSLSVDKGSDGRVLFKCFAGCEKLDILLGLRLSWRDVQPPERGRIRRDARPPRRVVSVVQDTQAISHEQARTRAALRIWRESKPAIDTPVEAYLHRRGIRISIPPTLRFHPRLKHPSAGYWPGMVALITRATDDQSIAVHRTFLSPHGEKASVEPQRMMLGPCRGGVVRLASAADGLMVGEGLETCLAATQATGRPVWAALSTAGLRVLELPRPLTDIIVLSDADPAGDEAARCAARRWCREGRRVRIARPPDGLDFNDLLCVEATAT